jgi:hypothetical protein
MLHFGATRVIVFLFFCFGLYSLLSFVLRLERSQIERGVFALVSFVVVAVEAGW